MARLRPAGDGKPRLFVARDARTHPQDPELVEAKKPTCTAEEIPGLTTGVPGPPGWVGLLAGEFGSLVGSMKPWQFMPETESMSVPVLFLIQRIAPHVCGSSMPVSGMGL